MTERARFFDAASYTEGNFSEVLSRLGTTGVIAVRANRLAPSLSGSNVLVDTGEAFVEGFWYQNDASKAIAIPANASATPRVDYVVLHLNRTANTLIAELHTGVLGAGAPTLTQVPLGDWEYPIAQLSTASGVTTLTDVRTYSNNLMTTAGDIIIAGAGALPTRLAKGANNTLFGVDGSGNVGYMATPRVTGLQVNSGTVPAAGGINAGGRITSLGFGSRVVASQALNPSAFIDVSLIGQAPGVGIIAIHAQYGDYGLSRTYTYHRNASSSNYFVLQQFGADMAGAGGGISWTVVVQASSGLYRITNTTPVGTAPQVTFNVEELPLLNAGT